MTHSEELGYLFYPSLMKDMFGMTPHAVDSEEYKMIKCLTQMWTDFAKTGYKKLNLFLFSNLTHIFLITIF